MNNAVYSDIDRSLKQDISGNYVIHYDADAIIQSLKTIFSTISGERVRNPIGSALIRLLFEPMNEENADSIRTSMIQTINRYEPRVNLTSVQITPDYANHIYDVKLLMSVKRLTNKVKFESKLRSLYA
jgi:phage baseplate assembly protein W